jgi:hypothetical protein
MCYKKVAATPAPTPPLNVTSPYDELGPGYCGATQDEEVTNRIGSWYYGKTKKEAEGVCDKNPYCNGFHWNVNDKSFVMVSHIPTMTCCESAKGDICYKRNVPWVNPASPLVLGKIDNCKDPIGQIVFAMKINHVSNLANPDVMEAIRQAVTAEAGPEVGEQNAQVMLGLNNTVQVEIMPPPRTSTLDIKSILATSTTLAETIRDVVAKTSAAAAGDAGSGQPVTVTDISEPQIRAVYCGSAAQSLFNGSTAVVSVQAEDSSNTTAAPALMQGISKEVQAPNNDDDMAPP